MAIEVNKREVGELARAVLDIADRRGYGLGECGYYFREYAPSYTEQTDENYLNRLVLEAEEYAENLQEQRKEYGQ